MSVCEKCGRAAGMEEVIESQCDRIQELLQERDRLREQVRELEAERRRDALDGQAALKERERTRAAVSEQTKQSDDAHRRADECLLPPDLVADMFASHRGDADVKSDALQMIENAFRANDNRVNGVALCISFETPDGLSEVGTGRVFAPDRMNVWPLIGGIESLKQQLLSQQGEDEG